MTRIDTFLNELVYFVYPLAEAIQDKESLESFCNVFGFDPADEVLHLILDDSESLVADISSSFDNIRNAADPRVQDVVSLTSSGFRSIEVIAESRILKAVVSSDEDLVSELFDLLLYQYLSNRVSLAEAALSALGVITHESIVTTDPGGREVDFIRVKFNWSRLADFVRNNEKWAYDVYGWAGYPDNPPAKRFDFVKAIRNAIGIVNASGLSLTQLREISDTSEIEFFLKHAPQDEQLFEAILPFYQTDLGIFDEESNQAVFSNEAGLKLVPFGDLAKPDELGIAVAPYIKGEVADYERLSKRLTLHILMGGQAVGGAYLTMTPKGMDVVGGKAVNAAFEFSTTYANVDESPILLAGDTQSTGIHAAAVVSAIGGNISGDFYLAGGFKGLKVVVDPRKDGFLGALFSGPIEIDAGDVILRWRAGRGVRFDGGTSLGVNVPLNFHLGAVSVRELQIALEMGTNVSVSMVLSIGARLGPIVASAEDVGTDLLVNRVPSGAGKIGKYDYSFGFKPPNRIGLATDAEGISGGGFLELDAQNYAGIMELSFQNEIDVTAFGLITTKLPDGKPGFSLVISILAEFQPIQLGLGFALTGVGGIIAVNRRMDEDALRETVKNHSLDAILFPSSPIRDAVKVIDAIQRILPPKEGVHVFGPMAELIWGGSVTLVEFHLGIFIEIGGPVRVALMGQAKSELPNKKAPTVVLNMDLLGFIDFGRETVAIDSSLFDSHIQKVPISGQMALRASWGEEADFAMSVGGFHPRFTPPPGFPALQRLAITLGDGNPRIALTAYLAITSNSLQFGARLELWAKKAGFIVTGGLAFDALFIFHPFSFEIAVEAWVDVRRGSVVLLGVALSLTLSGPNPFRATGYAKIKICWFLTIKVRFDKEFGKRIQQSQPVVSPLAVLRGELEEPRNTRFELPEWASAMLVFAEGAEDRLDRAGAWVFSQNAVPLNLPMERFGGGVPPAAERELRVEASPPGGSPLPGEAVEARFAPEQFHDWTVEEKLSAPAFESFESGLRLGGGLATAPEASHRHMPIEFETIVKESQAYLDSLPDGSPKKAAIRYAGSWAPAPARTRNWSRAGGQAVFAPRRRRKNRSHRNYVRVTEPTFAVAGQDAVDGLFQSPAAAGSPPRMTYSQATRITRRRQDLVLRQAATVTKGG